MEREKILIVEDSKVQAEALRAILVNKYDVKCVGSANDCITAVITEKFDLILLDMILPDGHGFEVIVTLMENESTKHVPIIILTSLDDRDVEDRGLELGAVDYIIKPFNPKSVLARIKTHLRLRSYANQLEQLTLKDQLTGIGNRRYFDAKATELWGYCMRFDTPLSVCMFDIDYFKAYNDTYGHPAGDKVLVTIAKELKKFFGRSTDIVARWGGEEFIVLVAGSTHVKDFAYVRKFLRHVEELHIQHAPDKQPYITISAGGITIIPPRLESIGNTVKAADENLYTAKETGRNKAVWTAAD